MYILIVARGFPSDKYPLNGIFEADQARALQSLGHKVVYIALDLRSFKKNRKYGKNLKKIDGIDVYTLSLPIGPIFYKLFFWIGVKTLLWVMKDVIKEHGMPDIVHSHFTVYSAIASTIKDKYKIPLVVTEHSSLINKDTLSPANHYWAAKGYIKANRVIAVSKALAKRIKVHFNLEVAVLPNIVDHNSFELNKIKHDRFTFISVGNLVEGKGFDILIDAFSNLKNDSHLNIIGDGRLYDDIKRMIESKGLGERIRLLGRKSRVEINRYMNESDVFVLASRSETFGVVYIEAMMTGLPIIATRCGGPEDFVTPESGILVPTNDPVSLAIGMKFMQDNVEKFNSEQISNYSKKTFSSTVVGEKLTKIYSQIIEKKYEDFKRD